MTARPNFLLIITDQHRADHLGCYGNRLVRTPNIDAIAARGARFDNFYVATPICMPNRATLMTGRMPTLHGARQNGIPLPMSATTFVDIMRATGYRTGLVGKCHLQSISSRPPETGMPVHDRDLTPTPDALKEAVKPWRDGDRYDQELRSTWEENPDFRLSLPYYGFEHVDLVVGHGDRATGMYLRWLMDRHDDPASLRSNADNQLAGNRYTAPQAFRTAMPEELYPTTYVEQKTIEYLEKHAEEEADAPFFLQCSFPDPHHPFTPPGKYWDMYDPAAMPLPPNFSHGNNPLPMHLGWLHGERDAGDADRSSVRAVAVNEREAREAAALTYGMITMVDDAVGRILVRLESLGLAHNTVVVFTTDHGDFMGDHQLLFKGALHYQGLVRVPFIWADPTMRNRTAGRVSDGLCGTLDIAATVLARAGLRAHNGNQGHSLLDATQGGPTGHDSVLIEEHQRKSYMGLAHNFRARTLITERWRMTLYDGFTWGELYDLKDDPFEMVNLWDDVAYSALRAPLMERLVRRMMDLSESSPLATHHGP